MRTQHEVHHQGYNTIRTVQNTKNEGILNVSWEGGETQVTAKGLGIRMASGISTTTLGGGGRVLFSTHNSISSYTWVRAE